ncbi:sodium/solute symporter [Neolewinella aurantiaca]|uniref:Sodium/solute symporter n=1 Tax=Neolewinella aurantiaca TaxID=2602767 RepID=A0A5C7FSR8_9BACT|nr:sodium/solute symporter [Neolewinella aurantiaca]TXF87741.1 sodium/solute symporter [Neolewinella aurantiaca]
MQLEGLDLTIFGVYIVAVIIFGIWISNRDKSATASDYFLAGRSLPWWAVGGSLIASNISAEQIIGMNGSGFELGLAIATYELMAAITLIIVAKFLLPVFLKKEIYTMPQFLEERYDGTVRTIMSVMWIALFVFVNISTVLYLGALAIEQLLDVPLYIGIIGLVIYSACFSIFGGLKAVVWTDVVQVVVLLLGGTIAAWGILSFVGKGSVIGGVTELYNVLPGHFEMLFEPSDTFRDTATGEERSSFNLLPGMALLLGGMWIVNTYYWGFNQYIIQRALAAKSLPEAQKGIAFAAFMKLFIPFFAVLPGIAAFYLLTEKGINVDIEKADQVFPWVLGNYVGVGFRGLTFAALVAAIGSSVSSMVNSASTIFTIDIYNKFINPAASQKRQVKMGQIAAASALIIGAIVAPALAAADQVFQVIQEYTGFLSPGVLVVFIFGMFYRRGTARAALVVILLGVPLSLLFKFILPDLAFLDRMALMFLISSALMIVLSGVTSKKAADPALNQTLSNASEEASSPTVSSAAIVKDMSIRNGIAVLVIVIGVCTAIRLFVQPVPGVPDWAVYLFAVLSVAVLALIYTDKQEDDHKAIDLEPSLFRTRMGFNISALAVLLILALIYGFLA